MFFPSGDIIKQLPFYDKLTETDELLIRQRAIITFLPKGKKIRCYDKQGFGVYYILDGEIRLFLSDEEHRPITLFSAYAGEMSVLSASCILTPISFEAYQRAEVDTTIYLIDAECFKTIIDRNLSVRCYVYELLAEIFSSVIENVESILFDDIDQRLINFLFRKHLSLKTKELTLTQREIAEAMSTSREVVGRALKRLSDANIISYEKGTITILSVEKLKINR
ncbi:MAG: Crp/Fnr family transcriptional regulator [Clostridia bacterium]|nr:Crp/Fnr family transcriptional regulator [Clostridia bacterium]